jgi:hypothetical protein
VEAVLAVVGLLVAGLALNRWILPRFGIRT